MKLAILGKIALSIIALLAFMLVAAAVSEIALGRWGATASSLTLALFAPTVVAIWLRTTMVRRIAAVAIGSVVGTATWGLGHTIDPSSKFATAAFLKAVITSGAFIVSGGFAYLVCRTKVDAQSATMSPSSAGHPPGRGVKASARPAPERNMRKAIIGAIIVLLLLAGGVWFLAQDPAGSDSYSVVAENDEGGAQKCGLEYMETLAQDAAGHDLYFKVTSSTELLEGIYPVALFAVHGLRILNPEAQSGEYLKIVDAGLAAGTVDTRQGMRRPDGDVEAFIATSTEINDLLSLPIDLLDGSKLTLRLAEEAEGRTFALPRVAATPANRLIACFKGMQERINAAAAAAKSGAGGQGEQETK